MSQVRTEFHEGHHGARLAVHRLGAGRPVFLLHGLFSSAEVNWIKFGHAKRLADAGFEAIMPDLRAHGHSAAPHDPQSYPPDVLVRDAQAMVSALALDDFDLVGFSLGARTAVAAVIAGLAPRRLALCGMGLEGLTGWGGRSGFFHDVIDRFGTIPRDDPAYFAQAFMKTMNVDRAAAKLLLASIDDVPIAALADVPMPTAVICGTEDRDNGSPEALAEALPDARHVPIPGTHMGCVSRRELGEATVEFLA